MLKSSWKKNVNEIEHIKKDFSPEIEETNEVVDVGKVENQSLKIKVKSLVEELAESNAKLENVSSDKPSIEPIPMSVLTEPSNSKG